MSGCTGCSKGCCGTCGGCGSMVLSPGEIQMLRTLWQIPFLPVAWTVESSVPVYLEENEYTPEEYSLILQCLEKRELISLEYGAPLKGCDLSAYQNYPIHGSFGLTAKGQAAAESLELQGVIEET